MGTEYEHVLKRKTSVTYHKRDGDENLARMRPLVVSA